MRRIELSALAEFALIEIAIGASRGNRMEAAHSGRDDLARHGSLAGGNARECVGHSSTVVDVDLRIVHFRPRLAPYS